MTKKKLKHKQPGVSEVDDFGAVSKHRDPEALVHDVLKHTGFGAQKTPLEVVCDPVLLKKLVKPVEAKQKKDIKGLEKITKLYGKTKQSRDEFHKKNCSVSDTKKLASLKKKARKLKSTPLSSPKDIKNSKKVLENLNSKTESVIQGMDKAIVKKLLKEDKSKEKKIFTGYKDAQDKKLKPTKVSQSIQAAPKGVLQSHMGTTGFLHHTHQMNSEYHEVPGRIHESLNSGAPAYRMLLSRFRFRHHGADDFDASWGFQECMVGNLRFFHAGDRPRVGATLRALRARTDYRVEDELGFSGYRVKFDTSVFFQVDNMRSPMIPLWQWEETQGTVSGGLGIQVFDGNVIVQPIEDGRSLSFSADLPAVATDGRKLVMVGIRQGYYIFQNDYSVDLDMKNFWAVDYLWTTQI